VNREALITACRHLAAAGLSPGSSGNLSIRLGDEFIVTPTGSSLSRVTVDDLAVVDLTGRPSGTAQPTKELAFHLALYRRRPEATAVVHLHSPYATAVSCLPPDARGNADLPPTTPYRVMRLGAVPLARYARPGSAELGAAVDELAADHAVMLLANHGSLVAASSLNAAIDLAEELEAAAQLTILLRGARHVQLGPDDVAELH